MEGPEDSYLLPVPFVVRTLLFVVSGPFVSSLGTTVTLVYASVEVKSRFYVRSTYNLFIPDW